MSIYKYKDILAKAKVIKSSVEKNYDYEVTDKWCYYIAKAILNPRKDVNGIGFKEASNPNGDYISRQIAKVDYRDMCSRVIKYVEKNKHLPNNVSYKNFKVDIRLFTYIIAYLLVHYETDGAFKPKVNISSKYFVKPSEPSNTVYDYFVKVFGKVDCIDDALDKISGHSYGYYYDDQYSNKQSIDRMKNWQGVNCTDSCQVFFNIAKALGYEVQCLHVLCSGGDGHVRLRLRHPKHTDNEWIYRDPACTLDNGGYCNWCTSNYTLLGTNPSWFMENLNR